MEAVTEFFYVESEKLTVELSLVDSKLIEIKIFEPGTPKRSPIANQLTGWTKDLSQELQEYLAGTRKTFSAFPLDLPQSAFFKKVYESLMATSPGQTLTYQELAKKAGNSLAARAVGSAMRRNKYPLLIPCHRVLPAHGKTIGQYSAGGGEASKMYLLTLEKSLAACSK